MNTTKGSGNKKLILGVSIGGGVLLVALVTVIVVLLTRPPQVVPVVSSAGGGRGTVMTPDNRDELMEAVENPVAEGGYRTKMSIEWTFPSSTEASYDAYVENAIDNTRTVYFDLFLLDTDELIYSSPYIPVGSSLADFALDVPVPAGEYDAYVKYHLVDDNNEEVSTVSVGITIRVLEPQEN